MLQKLTIQNYALIDNIEITFDKELNIITGETGAGKSILLGALSLLLGQRAESKYFYTQAKKCIIEGQFLISEELFKQQFQELDLDFEPISILRREISMDGKSRAFINDTPVNIGTLKLVSERLIAIHTQNATFELNQPEFQFLIIDSFAKTTSDFNSYQKQFNLLKLLQGQLKQAESNQEDALKKQDYEAFLLNELQQANLNIDEQDKLELELNKLKNVEHIQVGLNQAQNILEEQEYSVITLLKETLNQLASIEKHDNEISPYVSRIQESLIELKDLSTDLNRIGNQYHAHPTRVEEITSRLDIIYSLQQKHRVNSIKDLITIHDELDLNLQKHTEKDEEILKLQQEIKTLITSTEQLAQEISKKRNAIIDQVSSEILEKLIPLQLPHAKLAFELNKVEQLNKFGYDQIQLLFNANQGQSLMPVNKIASGGELSRLMLAVKAVLAKHTTLATLVFDEIDTGISGEAAQKVGNLLEELGQYMQLITISHLPQVASKGNAHYLVYKNLENNISYTLLKKLNQTERIYTIAQMLSGEKPSESAMLHAKELLKP